MSVRDHNLDADVLLTEVTAVLYINIKIGATSIFIKRSSPILLRTLSFVNLSIHFQVIFVAKSILTESI